MHRIGLNTSNTHTKIFVNVHCKPACFCADVEHIPVLMCILIFHKYIHFRYLRNHVSFQPKTKTLVIKSQNKNCLPLSHINTLELKFSIYNKYFNECPIKGYCVVFWVYQTFFRPFHSSVQNFHFVELNFKCHERRPKGEKNTVDFF